MAARKKSTTKRAVTKPATDTKKEEEKILKEADAAIAQKEAEANDVVEKEEAAKKLADEKAKAEKEEAKKAKAAEDKKIAEDKAKAAEKETKAKADKEAKKKATANMRGLIKGFLDYHDKKKFPIVTENIRMKTITAFSQIIRLALAQPTPDHLEMTFDFFKKHKDSILAPRTALQGVSSLPKEIGERVIMFYTLMTFAVEASIGDIKVPMDMKAARNVIKNDEIINFIATKLK